MEKLKIKRILKTTREKVTSKGILIKSSDYFSAETLQARRKWHDTSSAKRKQIN